LEVDSAGAQAGDCRTLEPATTPNHRGREHSCAAAGVLLTLSTSKLRAWQQNCRQWADNFDLERQVTSVGSFESTLLQLAAMLCRVLAGFLAGYWQGT
jgi:hypothetical protein